MKIFDCTLRDGANVVGNGFDAALTESMINGLLASGIKNIEYGNAKGMGACQFPDAAAPLDDLEYLKLAAPYMDKGNLGMFIQAKYATKQYTELAAAYGLRFLRVGTAAGFAGKAMEAVKNVKAAGLMCRYSQMKGYICTKEELAEEAKMLEDAGVDAITIMDSAGTMLPDEVKSYVSLMKQSVSIPVGFHGHNNLGLSQANVLAALEGGADEIDCGLLGMARSAGNCSTELTAALLYKMDLLKDVDLFQLLDYLNHDLIPAMGKHGYHAAVSPDDLILGLSGCHSSHFKKFCKIAGEENAPLYPLILKVSAMDKNAPSEELIRNMAQMLHGQEGDRDEAEE